MNGKCEFRSQARPRHHALISGCGKRCATFRDEDVWGLRFSSVRAVRCPKGGFDRHRRYPRRIFRSRELAGEPLQCPRCEPKGCFGHRTVHAADRWLARTGLADFATFVVRDSFKHSRVSRCHGIPHLQKSKRVSSQICPIMQRQCEIYGLAPAAALRVGEPPITRCGGPIGSVSR
jgi:hypothetical protein